MIYIILSLCIRDKFVLIEGFISVITIQKWTIYKDFILDGLLEL